MLEQSTCKWQEPRNAHFLRQQQHSWGWSVPLSQCRLDALDPNAYEAFKASRNLQDVVERVLQNQQEAEKVPGLKKTLSVQASLMTPVQPMLVGWVPSWQPGSEQGHTVAVPVHCAGSVLFNSSSEIIPYHQAKYWIYSVPAPSVPLPRQDLALLSVFCLLSLQKLILSLEIV